MTRKIRASMELFYIPMMQTLATKELFSSQINKSGRVLECWIKEAVIKSFFLTFLELEAGPSEVRILQPALAPAVEEDLAITLNIITMRHEIIKK